MKVVLRRLFDGFERDSITIEAAQFLIGRGNDCHLRPFCPLVSQHHCEIKLDNNRATVRDLESRNGTYVNCHRVHEPHQLITVDTLNVGLALYEVTLLEESVSPRAESSVARTARPAPRPRWTIGLTMPAYLQSAEP